jgi:predicted ester cyclase
MRCAFFITLVLAGAAPAAAAPIGDAAALALSRPHELIAARDFTPTERAALLKPVNAFYGFWTNGSPRLLAEALSPRFIDHTLPPGRPQGPGGPAAASKAFLAAVPDLRVTVVQRILVGDRAVSHLRFTGHFTGNIHGIKGRGQPVDFIATWTAAKSRGGAGSRT